MAPLVALVLLLWPPTGSGAPAVRMPVVVELFTSEGCSSCPAADALLARLLREQPVPTAEIIPLEFHVDYWDRLGWKDPFSAASATKRQQDYSSVFGADRIYTPQMVIDGRQELVGSDESEARRLVAAAARREHLPVRITNSVAGGVVRLTIDLPAAPKDAEQIDVVTVLTEDDLQSVVRRGENGGQTLAHAAVVRRHEVMASLGTDAFVAEGQWRLDSNWVAGRLRAVVLLQGRKSRHIYGAAATALR